MTDAQAGPSPSSGRRWWTWLAAGILAAALLWYSLRGIDWREVASAIAGADWRWLAAGAALSVAAHFLRSLRWRILLNAEARLSVGTVFWAMMAGYLGNNVLPARGGEIVRTYLISRGSPLSKAYVLTTALSERLMDVIALLLCSSVLLLRLEPKPEWMRTASLAFSAAAAAGALALLLLPRCGGLLERIVHRLPAPGRVQDRIEVLVGETLLGLKAFHCFRRMAGFTLLTAVVWLVDGCSTVAGARAVGISLPLAVALLLLTGLGLGSSLPSTPGYVGIYQFVAVTVLVPFGVSKDRALAYIVLSQAAGYVVVGLLGLRGLRGFRAGTAGG